MLERLGSSGTNLEQCDKAIPGLGSCEVIAAVLGALWIIICYLLGLHFFRLGGTFTAQSGLTASVDPRFLKVHLPVLKLFI